MTTYRVYYYGIPGSGIGHGTYDVDQFATGKQARQYVENVVFNGEVRTNGANMLDGNTPTDQSDWGRVQPTQPTVPHTTWEQNQERRVESAQRCADNACRGGGFGTLIGTLFIGGAVLFGGAAVTQGLAGVGAVLGGIVDGFNSTQVEQVQPNDGITAANCARYLTTTECGARF